MKYFLGISALTRSQCTFTTSIFSILENYSMFFSSKFCCQIFLFAFVYIFALEVYCIQFIYDFDSNFQLLLYIVL